MLHVLEERRLRVTELLIEEHLEQEKPIRLELQDLDLLLWNLGVALEEESLHSN